jgi:hypothetical protein
VHTRISALPQPGLLEIRVEGLSVETDPDRTTSREVMHPLFELASDQAITTLDAASTPLFTQRIVLGRPVRTAVRRQGRRGHGRTRTAHAAVEAAGRVAPA